jgi:hypothetical protein
MKPFSHYIITRFNIKNPGWHLDKNGNIINDLEWLTQRYSLFKTYCFPSVMSQVEKDFEWLVFFDKNTPEKFIKENNNFAKIMPQFKPLYVIDYLDFEEKLKVNVSKNSLLNYIITTRLDNDDCLHSNAVKKIQESFKPLNNLIIDLTNGLTLELGAYNKLAKRENVHSGPFISYIEENNKTKPVKTVYNCEHTSWSSKASFIDVKSGFYWMQIIHSKNITNKLHENLTVNKKLLKGFIFNNEVKFSVWYSVFVFLKNSGVFRFYNAVKRLLKKI